MKSKKSTNYYMRIVHRYLGFFLAGIMMVYAISGIVLVYRNSDTFKKEIAVEETIKPNLNEEELGRALKNRKFKVLKKENEQVFFKDGTYNSKTGEIKYLKKELPFVLKKMTGLHKASTNSPAYWLNIFFGASLLFFSVSTFWMFLPKTKVFKKGMVYTLGGIILTLILLFV